MNSRTIGSKLIRRGSQTRQIASGGRETVHPIIIAALPAGSERPAHAPTPTAPWPIWCPPIWMDVPDGGGALRTGRIKALAGAKNAILGSVLACAPWTRVAAVRRGLCGSLVAALPHLPSPQADQIGDAAHPRVSPRCRQLAGRRRHLVATRIASWSSAAPRTPTPAGIGRSADAFAPEVR
jgi:hypothetical protein